MDTEEGDHFIEKVVEEEMESLKVNDQNLKGKEEPFQVHQIDRN